MILVDTSVWIDHLNRTVAPLVEALEAEDVLIHPVSAELERLGYRVPKT